ncbi:diguanylate cyclase [Aestuariibacter sp. A3R04]|nr:diguanylate cyclase [Aestuariibacter sp. A3R04]
MSKSRVLIVDDDITTISLIADALSVDYEVLVATEAKEGLTLAAFSKPDLILLDVMLPGTSGFSLCRQLKSNEQTFNIPVIFVSALAEAKEQTRGFELGAVDYITKPIELSTLRARVRTHTRLYKQTLQLESLAATDALTGLANRRKFDECLAKEIERGVRAQSDISVLMVDIDDFKAYNDRYGHGKGDDCLIQVARVIKDVARRCSDLVCRLGGEEFGIILGETERSGAMTIAEAIIKQFNIKKIEHRAATTEQYLTVSIGATSLKLTPELYHVIDARQLVDTADEALYEAKSLGRNKVNFHPFIIGDHKKIS